MEIKDDTLFILNRRLLELTGYSLGTLLAYGMNSETRVDRKKRLKEIRDHWRSVRAKKGHKEQIKKKVRGNKYYGYGD